MGIRSRIKRIMVKHPRDYGEKISVSRHSLEDVIAEIQEYKEKVERARLNEKLELSKMDIVDALVDLEKGEFKQVIRCAKHNRYYLNKYISAMAERDKLSERK